MFPGTHAASAPNRPAVVMAGSGKTVTYRELDDNSARLASALHALGLRPGDVIAVWCRTTRRRPSRCIGRHCVPGCTSPFVNWHLAPEEAAYILRDSGARVVIVSAGVRAVAEPVVSLVPEVGHWYAFGGKVAGYRSYSELVGDRGTAVDRPAPRFGDALLVGHHRADPRASSRACCPGRSTNRVIRWSPCSRARSR